MFVIGLLAGCYQSRFLGTELTGTKHSHSTWVSMEDCLIPLAFQGLSTQTYYVPQCFYDAST